MANTGYNDAGRLMAGMRVVYEDKWLIVADKPSGLLTMATGKGGEVTAYSILTDYVSSGDGFRKTAFGRERERIFIVHRLDRDTSGLLVFAKDFKTKSLLQENWNETVLERKYTAILEGEIEDGEGWIETWLRENPKSMKMQCVGADASQSPADMEHDGWKYASSHCRTLKKGTLGGRKYTMVDFELETGRKNQIRAHAAWIGHPVAGDRKYGAMTNPIGRLCLHARTLSFTHPHTGKTMAFSSRLPKGFRIE